MSSRWISFGSELDQGLSQRKVAVWFSRRQAMLIPVIPQKEVMVIRVGSSSDSRSRE